MIAAEKLTSQRRSIITAGWWLARPGSRMCHQETGHDETQQINYVQWSAPIRPL